MSTVIGAPPREPSAHAPDGTSSRPGRRTWLLAVALGVVIAVASAAWAFLMAYQPLDTASGGGYGVWPQRLVERTREADPTEFPWETIVVPYRQDHELLVGFPVWNTGRLPVTVSGLHEWGGGTEPFSLRFVGISLPGDPEVVRPTRPARPFSLGSGEHAQVTVAISMDRPMGPGEAQVLTHVAFDFRVFGVDRIAELPLAQEILLCASEVSCRP